VTLINWGIIKHPVNWITVMLMVLIAGIAIHLVLQFYGLTPAKSTTKGS
jgi:hypothetical protein